ncbi:ATP-binding protein [Cellulomonas sp. PS-H5]|uniref:ATP-binding protein n=1 Tax=Cellulomonas sp. PS-H5 TaxID=2820400 RepID=UPI001C4E4E9B|nr:ATP-binding protein [Cellulomonas sp. PS-H5]MBW0253129.1 putative DNA binding domain-containing protein [Cellulomonas sp. PS-H5]
MLVALAAATDLDTLEAKHVDLKEEAGRRDKSGAVQPTTRQNEAAALQLAGEAACMANTEGGGALVVGVADDGTLVGTELDPEWLRSRIYDLTQRLLTIDAREVSVRGVRLLVVRSPQALEPVRWKGRISWRVSDRCVEVDAATWHARRMTVSRYDWSESPSPVEPHQVRPAAMALAREFLRQSGENAAVDLAGATDAELLRRLNVVTSDGYLTNAGALAFVGRPEPALDYVRRAVAGGDSVARVREGGRSVIEEIAEVERVIGVHNGVRQVVRGLVVGRVRDLPPLAVREAVVNGVVHRDWGSAAPTVVEHVGTTLTVTSPGGFVGGVTPDNIITHPSQARNRALAELFSSLRLAEREGIGVDRMVREMLSVGYPAPHIAEVAGPFVRAALVGSALDVSWIRFLSRLRPEEKRTDLTVLMLLRHLVERWWVDVARAAPLLQLSALEASGAIEGLRGVTIDGSSVLEPVAGVPESSEPAWRLSDRARTALAEEDEETGAARRGLARADVALEWARARGRVSSTELASVVGAQPTNVQTVLRGLEEAGQIEPGRPSRQGRGFFYKPTKADD